MTLLTRIQRATTGLVLALIPALTISADESEKVQVDSDSVVNYVLMAEKPEGGFGPVDQPYADVSRTYLAVATLKHLGAPVPNTEKILRPRGVLRDFTMQQSARGYHKASLCYLLSKDFDMRLVGSAHKWPGETRQTRLSMPEDNGGFGGHTITYPYTKIHNTFYGMAILAQRGREIQKVRAMCAKTPDFLASRQNPDGSWNNFPPPGVKYREIAPDVRGIDYWHLSPTIGHVHLTYCAVKAYELLGVDVPNKDKTVEWLQSCQGNGGGFTRAPGRGTEDVWETWAAVSALEVLGAEPNDRHAAIRFINSLQNSDGGFGDRPGWRSRIQSTYNAVAALGALTGDARKGIESKEVAAPLPVQTPDTDGMRCFCSFGLYQRTNETELIELAPKLGIDVIGRWILSYNGPADPQVVPLRKHAEDKGLGVTVLADSTNYRIGLYFEGTGQAQHSVNSIIWPPDVEFNREYMRSITHGIATFDELSKRMQLLKEKGGLSYWGGRLDMEAMERLAFDRVAEGKGGYDFIAVNGTLDRIKEKPWLNKYIGRVPFLLCISDMNRNPQPSVYYVRTLFVARSNSYRDFVEAVKANRVVVVYHREHSVYYGRPEWVQYVKENAHQWRPRWPEPPRGSERFAPRR